MQFVLPIIGCVVSALLSLNVFFLKKYFTEIKAKIDKVESMVLSRLPVQQNEIKNMANEIESLKNEIRLLSHELKDFGKLRERIAVIETLVNRRRTKGET